MKGHKGLHHRKHGGRTQEDTSVKHHPHHNKAHHKHAKGGSVHGMHDHDGNPDVVKEAMEGMGKGGGHIGGGAGPTMGRRRGGKAAYHGHHGHHKAKGGEIGADQHPFSSAHRGGGAMHKHGGACK